jgi:nucleotide sugar dehydrogenase
VGRLGICTALVLEKAGFQVLCYDVNEQIRDAINTRKIVSSEPGVSEMLSNAKNMFAVESIEKLLHLDTFFCVVPTPSLADGSYNHQYIETMAEEIIRVFPIDKKPKLLNICCTTMPGYCDTLQQKFEAAGVPIDVCYNPEFIAQGDILRGFVNPDILLIGEANERAGDVLVNIYKKFVNSDPKLCRMTRTEAEITKISINCFITTKISFANTIGDLCLTKGANPAVVLKAIGGDSRIGTKYLNWGHGYGGPCFPRDNRALCLFCKEQGVQNLIGEATDATNKNHLEFLKQRLIEKQKATGKPFLFRDLAYKPGTTILEESQSLLLAQQLDLEGYSYFIHDSDAVKVEIEKAHPHRFLFMKEPFDDSNYILVENKLFL